MTDNHDSESRFSNAMVVHTQGVICLILFGEMYARNKSAGQFSNML